MHTSSLYVLFVNLLIRHALYGNSYAVNWVCFFAYFCGAAVEVVFEDENPDPIQKKEREAERGREREICSRPIKLIRRKEVTTLTTPYFVYLTWLQLSSQLSVLFSEPSQETISAHMNIRWTSRKTRGWQFFKNLLNLNLHQSPLQDSYYDGCLTRIRSYHIFHCKW